jgi:hypothetical protein
MLTTNIKPILKNQFDRYFPTVRWPVLLVVLPALAIGLYNFIDVLAEVVIEKRRSDTAAYATRFASVQKDLPANAYVNYATDQEYSPDFILARYALIPARLEYGLKNRREFLVSHYLSSAKIPKFDGYKLIKNYQNGVMLFQRSR